MLDWWGPIIHEYYAGSEGAGFCAVSPEEWLAHPGTVGKAAAWARSHILDEDGTELPVGETGQIWFESADRLRVPRRPGEDRRGLRRARLEPPSATSATSTRTATSTSPTGCRT